MDSSRLKQIREEAMRQIESSDALDKLNDIRVSYLGKKGELTSLLKSMKDLTAEERPKFGQMVNDVRQVIENKLEETKAKLSALAREEQMKAEVIDVTLPAKKNHVGHRHPNTIALEEVERIFVGMGYEVMEGPEIELDYYNFEALNIPANHPAKDEQDTFYINDKIPFEEAEGVVFERLWQEENKDFLMNTDGNQAMPLEKQKEESATKNITSSDYSVAGDFAFYFKQGENTVTLESVQADMGIEEISLVPAEKLMSYQEYYAAKVAEGVPVISNGDLADPITIQAEDALVKSSPSILPQNNRSSTKTQPYHSTYIVYNTIGGESWSATGDGVTWQVEAPKEGLYKLSVRFRQALNRGFYSIREIRINGELPFQEAAEIAFPYKTDFQFEYLGDENGDYYFYLKEGTNTITMTATLASLSDAVSEVETCVRNLNELYRRLTSVMGTTPDQYRDYNILASVPDMVDIMKVEYVRLDNVIKMFGEDVNGGTKTSDLSQMMTILEKVIAKPDNITKQLTKLNDRLSALSSWMLNLGSQPLEMDYLMVCPDGYKLGKAEGGFFAKLKHSVLAFIGSYTNDYEVKSEQGEQTKQKTINVWISTSTRSQYEIVQSLINEHFKDSPYRVKLSMVGADTLLPSTVTGNGPDVAIQVNYSMPTNFAYRNAAYDLTQFYDFKDVASEFSPGAMEYMEYNGGYYGLPDQMSFPVIFYRKDIFEQLNLSVPETWEELQELIPYLEAENMSLFMNTTNSLTLGGTSTTSNKPINPIFLSML